jgi:hypothetical protein
MTKLGKALVLFNLAFGLMLASWAFSLYANGIDWSDRKGKTPGEAGGEYAVHEAQLDELWKGIPPAQANWLDERQKVLNEEARLAAERAWYDVEMKHLYVAANAANPIGEIAFAQKDDDKNAIRKGQILLDDKGHPQLVPLRDPAGNPLLSLAVYTKKDEDTLQSLEAVNKKQQEQIEKANELTDLIIGDDKAGRRGLYRRYLDEKAKDEDMLAEQKLVRPQLINTVVEAELILKRKNQLEKRIEELKKIHVASK